MPEQQGQGEAEKLDVQLNEAFERLEKRTDKPDKTIKKARNAGTGPGSLIGILLSLIAIGIASYAWYTAFVIQPLDQELASVRRQVESLAGTSTAQGKTLNDLNARLEEMQVAREQSIASIQQDVDTAINEIRRTMGTSSEDWLLAEVEYLLRLANHRVLLERDPRGAIALFEAADEIVRDAQGITAFELRKAIANDIAKLKAVRDVDVDGIFVRLSALKDLVGELKQRELAFEPRKDDEPGEAEEPEGFVANAMAMLARAGTRLAGLVEYRSEGEKIRPVLPPEEEYYLRQNLVLKLQLAQLALLRGDVEIFRNSLTEARQWVLENFSRQDPVTTAVVDGIDDAAAVDIARDMPNVSDSLREVRALLASFHQAEDSGSRQ